MSKQPGTERERTTREHPGRRALTHGVTAIRITLTVCLTLVVAGALVWVGVQVLDGRRAGKSLEAQWKAETAPTVSPPRTFQPGDVVGRIVIPAMSLDSPLVEMADVDDMENLNKGPAHIKGTALPGEAGNCVIAGHRTTHSRPFFRLDILRPGDEVMLIDVGNTTHKYTVEAVWIVDPNDVSVMDATSTLSVTLVACHPLYSAQHRIVVRAVKR